jgi:hypothetical protein
MNKQITKLSAVLFSVASLVFFTLIILYIFVYKPPTGTWDEKILHMNNNWGLISFIWKLEFIIVVIIAWVSFNFSTSNKWWNLVAIGHLLMLVEYMLMLGGYPKVASEETFQIVNNMAIWIFAASNLIWLLGMAGVYQAEKGWIKYLGITLALIGGVVFLTIVLGLTSFNDVIFVGPLANLLYLLNAYYGIKILKNKAHSTV